MSVFVSYAREDYKTIEPILSELKHHGFGLWIDIEGIEGSSFWRKDIVEAIKSSSAILFFASDASCRSDAVFKELALANEENKPILPVLLKTITIPSDLRYQLAGVQNINLSTDWNQGTRNIVASLNYIINNDNNKVSSNTNFTPTNKNKNAKLSQKHKLIYICLISFPVLIVAYLSISKTFFPLNQSIPNRVIELSDNKISKKSINKIKKKNIKITERDPNISKSSHSVNLNKLEVEKSSTNNTCFEFLLNKGWNLISIPIIPEHNSLNDLLKDAISCYSFLHNKYEVVSELSPGEGYWIKMNETKSYTICGKRFSKNKKKLYRGWHLVGSITGNSYPDITPSWAIDEIYTYEDNMYKLVSYFQQGKGYWLKVNEKSEFFLAKRTIAEIQEQNSDSTNASIIIGLLIRVHRKNLKNKHTSSVMIGVAEKSQFIEPMPNPPAYPCNIELLSIPGWNVLFKDIRKIGKQKYIWYISVNPHGNIGNPITEETSIVTWEIHNNNKQFFKLFLVNGINGKGDILVNNMIRVGEIEVSGINKSYNFTIQLHFINE